MGGQYGDVGRAAAAMMQDQPTCSADGAGLRAEVRRGRRGLLWARESCGGAAARTPEPRSARPATARSAHTARSDASGPSSAATPFRVARRRPESAVYQRFAPRVSWEDTGDAETDELLAAAQVALAAANRSFVAEHLAAGPALLQLDPDRLGELGMRCTVELPAPPCGLRVTTCGSFALVAGCPAAVGGDWAVPGALILAVNDVPVETPLRAKQLLRDADGPLRLLLELPPRLSAPRRRANALERERRQEIAAGEKAARSCHAAALCLPMLKAALQGAEEVGRRQLSFDEAARRHAQQTGRAVGGAEGGARAALAAEEAAAAAALRFACGASALGAAERQRRRAATAVQTLHAEQLGRAAAEAAALAAAALLARCMADAAEHAGRERRQRRERRRRRGLERLAAEITARRQVALHESLVRLCCTEERERCRAEATEAAERAGQTRAEHDATRRLCAAAEAAARAVLCLDEDAQWGDRWREAVGGLAAAASTGTQVAEAGARWSTVAARTDWERGVARGALAAAEGGARGEVPFRAAAGAEATLRQRCAGARGAALERLLGEWAELRRAAVRSSEASARGLLGVRAGESAGRAREVAGERDGRSDAARQCCAELEEAARAPRSALYLGLLAVAAAEAAARALVLQSQSAARAALREQGCAEAEAAARAATAALLLGLLGLAAAEHPARVQVGAGEGARRADLLLQECAGREAARRAVHAAECACAARLLQAQRAEGAGRAAVELERDSGFAVLRTVGEEQSGRAAACALELGERQRALLLRCGELCELGAAEIARAESSTRGRLLPPTPRQLEEAEGEGRGVVEGGEAAERGALGGQRLADPARWAGLRAELQQRETAARRELRHLWRAAFAALIIAMFQKDPQGRTALHRAAALCGAAMVAAVLSAHAGGGRSPLLEQRDERGCTALHVACERGNHSTARALAEAGADAAASAQGTTALHLAAASPSFGTPDGSQVLRVLASAQALAAVDDGGATALHAACSLGLLASAAALVDAAEQRGVLAAAAAARAGDLSVLHLAAPHRAFAAPLGAQLLRALAAAAPQTLSGPDADGATPLHLALANANPGVALALADLGADVTAPSGRRSGRALPLHVWAAVAAPDGEPGRGAELAERLAGPGRAALSAATADGRTPLHHAAWACNTPAVLQLLGLGASAAAEDSQRRRPLHLAAASGRPDSPAAVRGLWAARDAGAEAADAGGATPLHLAGESGAPAALAELARLGGDLLQPVSDAARGGAPRPRGATALHYAAAAEGFDSADAAELLRELCSRRGVPTCADGRTPLHWAAEQGRAHCTAALAALWGPELYDNHRRLPLHFAAAAPGFAAPSAAAAFRALASPAAVGARDTGGWTALHAAARTGQLEQARLLLELGADPLAVVPSKGRMPLHWAAGEGHAGLVRLLAEAGPAAVAALDTGGAAPLHHAAAAAAAAPGPLRREEAEELLRPLATAGTLGAPDAAGRTAERLAEGAQGVLDALRSLAAELAGAREASIPQQSVSLSSRSSQGASGSGSASEGALSAGSEGRERTAPQGADLPQSGPALGSAPTSSGSGSARSGPGSPSGASQGHSGSGSGSGSGGAPEPQGSAPASCASWSGSGSGSEAREETAPLGGAPGGHGAAAGPPAREEPGAQDVPSASGSGSTEEDEEEEEESEEGPLPEGWVEFLSPKGFPYYHQRATGTTQWVRPRPAPAQQLAAPGEQPAPPQDEAAPQDGAGGATRGSSRPPADAAGLRGAGGLRAVVLDVGSCETRAGFAGERSPRFVFPSIVGRPRSAAGQGELFAGWDAHERRGVLRIEQPIERGLVADWGAAERLWRHAFGALQAAPGEQAVLLTECALQPPGKREKAAQLLFEGLGVPALYLAEQGALSLRAAGRVTGLALHCGEGGARAVPVYEGHGVRHATVGVDVGGGALTDWMARLLGGRELPPGGAREAKEQLAWVAPDFAAELAREPPGAAAHRLPDGSVLTLAQERFRCPEALFQPALAGVQGPGVHEAVRRSVALCDPDLHGPLRAAVLLGGGTTMCGGFPERLGAELGADFQVVAPPERALAAWRGGSAAASLASYGDACVSKAEYDEHGPAVVHMKCF